MPECDRCGEHLSTTYARVFETTAGLYCRSCDAGDATATPTVDTYRVKGMGIRSDRAPVGGQASD